MRDSDRDGANEAAIEVADWARYVPAGMAGILAMVALGKGGSDAYAHLLDWPFLLFCVFALVVMLLGKDITKLLNTRKWEFGRDGLKVGDWIEDVESQSTDDFQVLTARLDELERRVGQATTTESSSGTKAAGGSAGLGEQSDVASADPGAEFEREAYERMKRAIQNSRHTWRSVQRLAIEAGIDESSARRILSRDGEGEIKLGVGKSGRRIARLL